MTQCRGLFLFAVFFIPISCMTFTRVDEFESFSDWYWGRAGIDGTIKDNRGDKREWYSLFLHFRLPELISNTQYGIHYPPGEAKDKYLIDAGVVELIFPYREWFEKSISTEDKFYFTLTNPIITLPERLFGILLRFPVYLAHDALKTVATPFVGIGFAIDHFNNKQPETSNSAQNKKGETQ